MTRRFSILLILSLCTIGPIRLAAHEEFRIIGTLEKREGSTIFVKKSNGRAVPITLDRQTAIMQDNKKVDAAALKVGQSLVVDSYGDAEDYSQAIEIRIVPPIKR